VGVLKKHRALDKMNREQEMKVQHIVNILEIFYEKKHAVTKSRFQEAPL